MDVPITILISLANPPWSCCEFDPLVQVKMAIFSSLLTECPSIVSCAGQMYNLQFFFPQYFLIVAEFHCVWMACRGVTNLASLQGGES